MYLFLKNFWKTIVWACVIIVLSCMPEDNIQSQKWNIIPNQDKFLHLLFYGILGYLLIKALQIHFKMNRLNTRIFIISFLFILILGIILELVQEKMIQSREGEVLDLLFDLIGFFICFVFIYFAPYLRKYFTKIRG
jgi:VanZ family protein